MFTGNTSQNRDRNKSISSKTDESKGKAFITHLFSGFIKWGILLSPEKPHCVVFQEHSSFLSYSTLAVRATVIAKMTQKHMFD